MALTEADGVVRVDVRDNGPGIKPEDQAIIFDKFRQAGDTLTEKPPGTGLGLHISRQIIEHFGGRMWVREPDRRGRVLLVHPAGRTGRRAGGVTTEAAWPIPNARC